MRHFKFSFISLLTFKLGENTIAWKNYQASFQSFVCPLRSPLKLVTIKYGKHFLFMFAYFSLCEWWFVGLEWCYTLPSSSLVPRPKQFGNETTLAALGAWSRESKPLFASTPCLHSTWGVCLSTESLTIFSGQLTWMSWWLNSYIALRWLLTTGRGGKVCHRILHGEQVVWQEATPRQNGRLNIHRVLDLFLIDLLYS